MSETGAGQELTEIAAEGVHPEAEDTSQQPEVQTPPSPPQGEAPAQPAKTLGEVHEQARQAGEKHRTERGPGMLSRLLASKREAIQNVRDFMRNGSDVIRGLITSPEVRKEYADYARGRVEAAQTRLRETREAIGRRMGGARDAVFNGITGAIEGGINAVREIPRLPGRIIEAGQGALRSAGEATARQVEITKARMRANGHEFVAGWHTGRAEGREARAQRIQQRAQASRARAEARIARATTARASATALRVG